MINNEYTRCNYEPYSFAKLTNDLDSAKVLKFLDKISLMDKEKLIANGYSDYLFTTLKNEEWIYNKSISWFYDTGLNAVQFYYALKKLKLGGFIDYDKFLYNIGDIPMIRIFLIKEKQMSFM